MSTLSRVELVARMRVRSGTLERVKALAAECMRQAAARDVGTLGYDWFVSRDGMQCEERGLYADSESLLQHRANVRDVYDLLVDELAEEQMTSAYGEPSPQVLRLADTLGAGVTWFSPFRGLAAITPRD